MADQTQLSEQQVLAEALVELGVSSEDSVKITQQLQMQTGKLVMLELLSRLAESDYATLREQLANKDVDAQAQVMKAYLEKRFTMEERRQAMEAALKKMMPELQKQLSQKMAGMEINETDQVKLEKVMDKLSNWLASASSAK